MSCWPPSSGMHVAVDQAGHDELPPEVDLRQRAGLLNGFLVAANEAYAAVLDHQCLGALGAGASPDAGVGVDRIPVCCLRCRSAHQRQRQNPRPISFGITAPNA